MYDSTQDVKEHIHKVCENIKKFEMELDVRCWIHDASKLEEPEKSMYDEFKPKIRVAEQEFGYGSKEYEECLQGMGEALRHHFKSNRHHPEYFENGINGMTLVDIIEMFCDWKAASSQYNTKLNIPANKNRFGISDQLSEIFENTARELDW